MKPTLVRALPVLAGLALLIGSPVASEDAGITSAQSKSCRGFVQSFYDGYLRALKKSEAASDLTVKHKPAALSPELLRQLQEDLAAQSRVPDEIVGLDFDPFLNAQDRADRYQVGAVSRKGNGYRVEVFAVSSGKKSEKPDVVPELVRQGSRWIFVNFHYGVGKEQSDLLGILKGLREERQSARQ